MNAIFQVFNGNLEGYGKCLKTVEDYCHKYDIRLYRSFYTKLSEQDYSLEKIMSLGLLNMFDRVLSVDGDVMITPNAQNIFASYPDETTLYAYQENDYSSHMDRDKYIKELDVDFEWPIGHNGKYQYFNAGVMLWSKKVFKDLSTEGNQFLDTIWATPKKQDTFYFGEQTPLNYAVAKHKLKFQTIDHSFNRMDLGNYDPDNQRYKANFIHYAGPCKYNPGMSKREAMELDYKNLYVTK